MNASIGLAVSSNAGAMMTLADRYYECNVRDALLAERERRRLQLQAVASNSVTDSGAG